MIWTATKQPVFFDNGMVVQKVVYTDGVESFSIDYRSNNPPVGWPDVDIKNRLDAINNIDLSKYKAGPFDPNFKLPDPPAPPAQTQAEIDKAKFFTDFKKERTQQILASLSPELAARYLPEYGNLF